MTWRVSTPVITFTYHRPSGPCGQGGCTAPYHPFAIFCAVRTSSLPGWQTRACPHRDDSGFSLCRGKTPNSFLWSHASPHRAFYPGTQHSVFGENSCSKNTAILDSSMWPPGSLSRKPHGSGRKLFVIGASWRSVVTHIEQKEEHFFCALRHKSPPAAPYSRESILFLYCFREDLRNGDRMAGWAGFPGKPVRALQGEDPSVKKIENRKI